MITARITYLSGAVETVTATDYNDLMDKIPYDEVMKIDSAMAEMDIYEED